MSTGALTITQEIAQIESQLEQLRHRAVQELQVELAEAKNRVSTLERAIAERNPKAVDQTANGSPAPRRKRHAVTIEAVVEAIRQGAVNYRGVAAALGCTAITVARKIENEGKAAGIKITGQRAGLRLSLRS